MAYHVNPDTGRPNICRASTRACPHGGPDDHFETSDEARSHFEQSMSGQTVAVVARRASKNLPENSKLRLSPQTGSYFVDYEYDSYDCDDYYSCSESGDYCRDKQYEGLRVENVTDQQVYDFAKASIGAVDLPDSLKTLLDQNMEEWTDSGSWDAYGEPDYYGDTVVIDPPKALEAEIATWFYNQEGAVDKEGVLPYLRGMGMDTTGKDPVSAVKQFIADRNGGKLPSDVAAARVVEVKQIGLRSVAVPNQKRFAATPPVMPVPVPESGVKNEVCGVVLETTPGARQWRGPTRLGEVKLLDGYGRLKHYQGTTKRTKATFIVLRKQL